MEAEVRAEAASVRIGSLFLVGPIRKHLLLSFLEGAALLLFRAYWEPAEVFGVGFA